MSDELQHLLNATSDEAPRPEFVAELRSVLRNEMRRDVLDEQILSEATQADDGSILDVASVSDDDPYEVLTRTSVVRWAQTAAAAAVIGVVVLAWMLFGPSRDESELETIDIPEEVVDALDVESGPIALTITSGRLLEPREYETTLAGTTITFSTSEDLAFAPGGGFEVKALGSRATGDRTLGFRRLSALPDPNDLTQSEAEFQWAADDTSGWIQELDAGVLRGEPQETVVGGVPATRIELQVSEFGCGRAGGCVIEFNDGPGDRSLFRDGALYRLWIVDQGEQDPILVSAGIDDPSDEGWFTEIDQIVESVRLGAPRENPVRSIQAADLSLQAFGGSSFVIPGEAFVEDISGRSALINFPQEGITLALFTSPVSLDGVPITTIDHLEGLFEERLIDTVQRTTLDADGTSFLALDLAQLEFSTPLFVLEQSELSQNGPGWNPSGSSWWVAEDPNLGVLIIEASARGNALRGEQLDFVDSLVASLDFQRN